MRIKEQLFNNWTPMRWFMLIFGLILGHNYIVYNANVSGILAVLILYQTLNNSGCFLGNCKTYNNSDRENTTDIKTVTYEEINID